MAKLEAKKSGTKLVKTKKKESKKKVDSKLLNAKSKKALLIIRGRESDFDNLKKLKDNIEFELVFKKTRTTTYILDGKEELDQYNVMSKNRSDFDLIIIINQQGYNGDGFSDFQTSTFDYRSSSWNNYDPEPLNILDRRSLKQFSKKLIIRLQ